MYPEDRVLVAFVPRPADFDLVKQGRVVPGATKPCPKRIACGIFRLLFWPSIWCGKVGDSLLCA